MMQHSANVKFGAVQKLEIKVAKPLKIGNPPMKSRRKISLNVGSVHRKRENLLQQDRKPGHENAAESGAAREHIL